MPEYPHNEIDEIMLTEEQEAKLSAFMAEFPQCPRKLALRFLIGRKWEMERVRRLYMNYQRTVKDRHLENVTIRDVVDEMRTQKMYLPGTRARDSSALFVIWGGRHVPGQFTSEQTIKLAFYLNQVGMGEDVQTQRTGFTILVNLEGVEWANSDVAFLKGVVDFFTDNVPAAVKHIVVWRAPWWINMLVKMVLPFLKEKMRNRIVITDDASRLHELVEPDELPMEFPGGTCRYDHAEHIEMELAKTSMALHHLSSAHQDSTFSASPQPAEPIGVEHYIPDELAAKLRDERRRHFEELRLKVQAIRTTLQSGHGVPVQAAWLGATKRGRLSLQSSDLDRMYLPPSANALADEATKRPRIIPTDPMPQDDLTALIKERMAPNQRPPIDESKKEPNIKAGGGSFLDLSD